MQAAVTMLNKPSCLTICIMRKNRVAPLTKARFKEESCLEIKEREKETLHSFQRNLVKILKNKS
jgi:hypothetical protein